MTSLDKIYIPFHAENSFLFIELVFLQDKTMHVLTLNFKLDQIYLAA